MEPAVMDASHLTQFIEEQGITADIVFLEEQTPTVETAANAVGVDPSQILKSVLFVVKEGAEAFRPILVVASGLSRISYKRLADYLDVSRRQVRIARPAQVKELTGYAVGTVPPFGHRQRLDTILDEDVLEQEEVYAGGGAINALIHIHVVEMQRVLEAEVVALTE